MNFKNQGVRRLNNSEIYLPRVYTHGDPLNECVVIEFSASKLLLSNNVEELKETDFPVVIDVLQERLRIVGVEVEKSELENTRVVAVHFSRNIELQNGYTSSFVIAELSKLDITKRFDLTRVKYVNQGDALYLYTNSHQFVLYDKVADLQKNTKRAVDKEKINGRKDFYTTLQNNRTEILRFEVRLCTKKKINELLKQFGYTRDSPFREIFNEELSRRIIHYYWEEFIIKRNIGLLSFRTSVSSELSKIVALQKKINITRAIYLMGLLYIWRDGDGMRYLRNMVSKKANKTKWSRISIDISDLNELMKMNNLSDWVRQINEELKYYKPYKIKNYEKSL